MTVTNVVKAIFIIGVIDLLGLGQTPPATATKPIYLVFLENYFNFDRNLPDVLSCFLLTSGRGNAGIVCC